MRIADFDPVRIAASGQCFRMTNLPDGSCEVLAKDRYIRIERGEKNGDFLFSGMNDETAPGALSPFWRNYFDLQTDYGKIRALADPQDSYLRSAVKDGCGLRILRQDLFETIISFIVTQQNNIPRIRRTIRLLCGRYGKKIAENEEHPAFFAFPEAEVLAEADLADLAACSLGYRAEYVKETSRQIVNKEIVLDEILSLPYDVAKKKLLQLRGVGAKVADCICLFARHDTDAFPVDVHVRRALDLHYPQGFPYERYAGYAGVMQQYIFFHEILKP